MPETIIMHDPEEAHELCLDHASDKLGEYLTELGITDLTQMSKEQWREMLDVVQKNYFFKKSELTICPF